MDNIGSTNVHYKNISAISVSILLVIFQAYLMLILGGFDIFNFSMLQDDIIRYIIPVSYTHLDVYKRQEHLAAKAEFGRQNPL